MQRSSLIVLFSQSPVSHRYERLLEPAYVTIVGSRSITGQEFRLDQQLPIRVYLAEIIPRCNYAVSYLILLKHSMPKCLNGISVGLRQDGRVDLLSLNESEVVMQVTQQMASAVSFVGASMSSYVIYASHKSSGSNQITPPNAPSVT